MLRVHSLPGGTRCDPWYATVSCMYIALVSGMYMSPGLVTMVSLSHMPSQDSVHDSSSA